MTVAEEIRQMRRALGQELARLRQAAGFTQRQFAPLTAYSRSTLSDAELGRSRVGRDFWERCQAVLQAGDTLTRRYDETEAVAAAHQAAAVHDARSARGPLTEVPVTVQVCPVCHQPVKVILLAGNPGRRLPASPPGGDSAGMGTMIRRRVLAQAQSPVSPPDAERELRPSRGHVQSARIREPDGSLIRRTAIGYTVPKCE